VSEKAVKKFRKTERQKQACFALNGSKHTMLFGGSRAGKTFIALRNIILRAQKLESRHLVIRRHFNHCKTSIVYDTLPKVLEICFPELVKGVHFKLNRTDWYLEIKTSDGTGTSTIWFGGIDDKERAEKVLGNEYSTIMANECSQLGYDAITTLRTRLAETSGLKLKFYYDMNPAGKSHWTHKEFIEKLVPEEKRTPSTLDSGFLLMNPADNLDNLPDDYLSELMALPKRKRQRFLDGLFLSDVEGALWSDKMISTALSKQNYGEFILTIVAVDPSISHQKDSDECGIVVGSKDAAGNGIIQADLSGQMSTKTWAQTAVNAYYEYDANYVVAEVNQGGDLVVDAIKAIDETVPVKMVHASKGKFARAEPVSELYELERVAHLDTFLDLETQLTEYVPINSKKSPDRLDALVWCLSFLLLKVKPLPRARAL
jgi:PBSX family phage terminase large subunit